MLKNRHIVCYVALLLMFAALGCPASLSAQTANYVNASGTTVETRFILPDGYTRVAVPKNSYAYYLRRLRMLPYSSAAYNNSKTETPNVGQLNLPVIDNLQQDIHLCVRLRGEYLFSREQYNKIAFSISTGRMFYVECVEGLNLVINDVPHHTKQPTPINRLRTFQNFLKFIFTHATVNSIMLDAQPVSINNILPGDMFIQPGLLGAAVVVLDVAHNPATGDRLFLLAKHDKTTQIAYVLTNPRESWSGSPWYSIKTNGNRLITPEFAFYKSDLQRFLETYTSTTAKK